MDVDRFAGLRREIDALVEADPAGLSCGEDVLAAQAQLARLDAFVARQAAGFDEDPVWPLSGAQTSAAWVTARRRCAPRVAKLRRRLGHAVRQMPLVEQAWLAGELGAEHVEVLAGRTRTTTPTTTPQTTTTTATTRSESPVRADVRHERKRRSTRRSDRPTEKRWLGYCSSPP
jgi:hypothetical protein